MPIRSDCIPFLIIPDIYSADCDNARSYPWLPGACTCSFFVLDCFSFKHWVYLSFWAWPAVIACRPRRSLSAVFSALLVVLYTVLLHYHIPGVLVELSINSLVNTKYRLVIWLSSFCSTNARSRPLEFGTPPPADRRRVVDTI